MNMDHSAWEGWVIDGKVDTVLSRGTVVIENDTYVGSQGSRPVHQAWLVSTSSRPARRRRSALVARHDRGNPPSIYRLAIEPDRLLATHSAELNDGVHLASIKEEGTEMNRISHWIDGKVVAAASGRSGVVWDPATGQQQAAVDLASADEVDHAVAVAKAAFPAWRATNLSRRAEVMFHMRELVDANRKEIATLLTKEHGKVLGDALGEVARGLENIEFACGIPNLLKGGYSEQASTGDRRLQHQAAARRGGRHHAVQLPGDGADVDVRQRPRVRQHVRAQAQREGSVGQHVHRPNC